MLMSGYTLPKSPPMPSELRPTLSALEATGFGTFSSSCEAVSIKSLTPRVTGPMFQNIGWGTYAFFAAMNLVIIFPTVWYLFPETKGRSLEDVSMACGSSLTSARFDLRRGELGKQVAGQGQRADRPAKGWIDRSGGDHGSTRCHRAGDQRRGEEAISRERASACGSLIRVTAVAIAYA